MHPDQLRSAVFEVVVPKYEPAGVTYAEELPFHLLPKHVREDPYLSIGTAFTMDGATFISAAHVFLLDGRTQYDARRLRAADGKVYEIDQFLRYSDVRDLVAFTLRDPPAVETPLERGATPAVSATVHTVGNAQGEGVSVRGGNVASFTPEPFESAWQYIRYSAPTSPGNSGGPLLDDHGRVVGVVVRKNDNENLNYAVPIEELDRLSSERAEFYDRYSEVESGERLVGDLFYEADLPADYATLAASGQERWYAAVVAHRAEFEKKFRDRLFPTSPELRSYLREQGRYYYPTEVVRDASGVWSTSEPTVHTIEVSPEQFLYVGKDAGNVFLVMERPKDVPLATFVNEPERVLEAFIDVSPFKRKVAGVDVRITSYGPPHARESWQDALGRPWITVIWRLWDDHTTAAHCTTYPRGLACVFREIPTRWESTLLLYARINAPRWTLSYDGRVRDWVDYLALDPALRPTFLSGTVMTGDSKIDVSLGSFHVAASGDHWTADSIVYAESEYASLAPPSLRVASLALLSNLKGEAHGFRVDRFVEPLSETSRTWWEDVVAKKSPYDGKVTRKDDRAELTLLDKTPPITFAPDTGVEARLAIYCWTTEPDSVTDKQLAKSCSTFRKSVTVSSE